jgi:hypothetical protein
VRARLSLAYEDSTPNRYYDERGFHGTRIARVRAQGRLNVDLSKTLLMAA